MTRYVILRRDDSDPELLPPWIQMDRQVDASSASRAISAFLTDEEEATYAENSGETDYVAVPVRSFVPLTVKVEQTTKVTIG